MLAKLELKLQCEEKITYQMTSLFHGALMELLPKEYAEYLHLSQLHPYSQHLEYRENNWYWVVCGLNRKAVQTIIKEALWEIKEIFIKKHDLKIQVVQKQYVEIAYKDLTKQFYSEDADRYIQIHFLSPTAFKQNGIYLFYPDLRCIFQSLMNKYDSAGTGMGMADEETLEQLTASARIIKYDLKSVSFALEGIRIPAFIGKITIRIQGSQTMANFAKLLVKFGTYSGVGIKTALGMGSIRMIKEGDNHDNRPTD